MQWKWKACCVYFVSKLTRRSAKLKTHIADTPSDGAFLGSGTSLVGLAVDAQVHDVVAADGAVVHDNVPSPESNGVPLEPSLDQHSVHVFSRIGLNLTFFTSNLFFPPRSPDASPLELFTLDACGAAAASVISTSAMTVVDFSMAPRLCSSISLPEPSIALRCRWCLCQACQPSVCRATLICWVKVE